MLISPPTLPILQKLVSVYKLWHEYFLHFDKATKYTLGLEIEALFIGTIRNIFIAIHKNREQKAVYLNRTSDEFDLLKFLLQIVWEVKALDNKKYIALSKELEIIGKMLGGWLKQTITPQ